MSINDVILMSILALTALNCISDLTRILIMQAAQWNSLNQMNKQLFVCLFVCFEGGMVTGARACLRNLFIFAEDLLSREFPLHHYNII